MVVSIYLVLLVISAVNNVNGYVCETQVKNTEESGSIESPEFPGAYPDGPYTCTYEIRNDSSKALLLEFTDFLTTSSFGGEYTLCKTRIKITPVDPIGEDKEFVASCNSTEVFHVIRSGAVTVTFDVRDKNIFKTPGFKIKYSRISAAEVLQRRQGRITILDDPYKKGLSSPVPADEDDLTSVNIEIIRSYSGYHIDYLFPKLDTPHGAPSFSLEFRDGPTSDSELMNEYTHFRDTIYHTMPRGEYLYVKYTTHYPLLTIPGSYVIFSNLNPCPAGFFHCPNYGQCIGLTALCDGIDNCGDNSDENEFGVTCADKARCDGELSCQHDMPCEDGTTCQCDSRNTGYTGDKCEYGWNDFVDVDGGVVARSQLMVMMITVAITIWIYTY